MVITKEKLKSILISMNIPEEKLEVFWNDLNSDPEIISKYSTLTDKEQFEFIRNTIYKYEVMDVEDAIIDNDDVCFFKGFENRILLMNDAWLSYIFCTHFSNANVKAHEDVVIDCLKSCGKDASIDCNRYSMIAYEFAKNVDGANIERLRNVIAVFADNHWLNKIDKIIEVKKISKVKVKKK